MFTFENMLIKSSKHKHNKYSVIYQTQRCVRLKYSNVSQTIFKALQVFSCANVLWTSISWSWAAWSHVCVFLSTPPSDHSSHFLSLYILALSLKTRLALTNTAKNPDDSRREFSLSCRSEQASWKTLSYQRNVTLYF